MSQAEHIWKNLFLWQTEVITMTNAEYLAKQLSDDISRFAAYLCWNGWMAADMIECEAWLQRPVDDDLIHFFHSVCNSSNNYLRKMN